MPARVELGSASKTGGCPPYLDDKCIIPPHNPSSKTLRAYAGYLSEVVTNAVPSCIHTSPHTRKVDLLPITSGPPSPGYAPSSSFPRDPVTQYQVHVRYVSRLPGVLENRGPRSSATST